MKNLQVHTGAPILPIEAVKHGPFDEIPLPLSYC